MNEIIADSGFAPEWIMLRKDVLAFRSRLRETMRKKTEKIEENIIENRQRYDKDLINIF